jgi:hypothetical protein
LTRRTASGPTKVPDFTIVTRFIKRWLKDRQKIASSDEPSAMQTAARMAL